MQAAAGGVFFDKANLDQEKPRVRGTYEIDSQPWDTKTYGKYLEFPIPNMIIHLAYLLNSGLAFSGLGRANPAPNPPLPVTPVAVIPAEPSSRYFLAPTQKYYMSTGKLLEGTVVIIKQLGQTALVDFTNRNENHATVDLREDLTYGPVKYSVSNNIEDE